MAKGKTSMWIWLALVVALIWWLGKDAVAGQKPTKVSGNVSEGDGFQIFVPGGGNAFDPSSLNARQPGTP